MKILFANAWLFFSIILAFHTDFVFAQRIVKTGDGLTVVDYDPQPKSGDEFQVPLPPEIVEDLANGITVVMPTNGQLRKQLRKDWDDPFHTMNYSNLAYSLRSTLESQCLLSFLDLTGNQKDTLSELVESHQKRVSELFAEAKRASDPQVASAMFKVVDEEKVAFCKEVKDQLTVEQQLRFPFHRRNASTPKLLVHSNLGDALELSQLQKDQLRAKSKKLNDELQEFLRAKREESVEILAEVLSEAQLKSLVEIRGTKGVTDNTQMSFEALLRNHEVGNEHGPLAKD